MRAARTPVEEESMHYCISAMPGAGLSLIASLLTSSGMAIAPYQQLPEPTTPIGALPAIGLAAISQQWLTAAGATWERPIKQHTPTTECAQQLTEEARGILNGLGTTPTGWVDPLAGLVLPFWQALLPDLKIIWVLRNPLEIAQVFQLRNRFWVDLSLQLWLDYHQALINANHPQLLIVHFDSALNNSVQELRRITDFLNITLPQSAAEQVSSVVDRSLHQHQQHPYHWLGTHMPHNLPEMYLNLCAYAGPYYQQALRGSMAHFIQHQQVLASQIPQTSVKQLMARIAARRLAQQLITGGI
jgi:hypothetical protein